MSILDTIEKIQMRSKNKALRPSRNPPVVSDEERRPGFTDKGELAISLKGVLEILNIKIVYEESELRFHNRKTKKLIFAVERDEEKTPFDHLRKRKYFDAPKFDKLAAKFLKTYMPPSQQ